MQITKNIIDEIGLKNAINKYKNTKNSLKNLLINCRDEEIAGLVYYYSKELKENDDDYEELKEKYIYKEKLKEKVINKMYKILPQDIISILPKNNIIVKKYLTSKNIFNYKDYINKEENKIYKISIIYTFSNIENKIDGLNKGMSFNISEIKSEIGMKNIIEEIKHENEFNIIKEYHICIHFEQSESKKIQFISYYILNHLKNDNYNYIFIIHIKRDFNNNERIYSLADINNDINQLFIDDLNGNDNIKLNYLLIKDNIEILKDKKDVAK
jgi:hypothetical protein